MASAPTLRTETSVPQFGWRQMAGASSITLGWFRGA
jgi:hypothetical protein